MASFVTFPIANSTINCAPCSTPHPHLARAWAYVQNWPQISVPSSSRTSRNYLSLSWPHTSSTHSGTSVSHRVWNVKMSACRRSKTRKRISACVSSRWGSTPHVPLDVSCLKWHACALHRTRLPRLGRWPLHGTCCACSRHTDSQLSSIFAHSSPRCLGALRMALLLRIWGASLACLSLADPCPQHAAWFGSSSIGTTCQMACLMLS